MKPKTHAPVPAHKHTDQPQIVCPRCTQAYLGHAQAGYTPAVFQGLSVACECGATFRIKVRRVTLYSTVEVPS